MEPAVKPSWDPSLKPKFNPYRANMDMLAGTLQVEILPKNSCTFGKYHALSLDFFGGKIISLELNLDPGVSAGNR